MGQFKPMVKMETTEPSVILKLKKGGTVKHMPKMEADSAGSGHKKMAGGGLMAMMGKSMPPEAAPAPAKPSMAMRRKAMMPKVPKMAKAPPMASKMPSAIMKKGGHAESKEMGADLAQDKAMIKKAMKQHDEQEHKGDKGTKLKLKTGGVSERNGGGYKTGGVVNGQGGFKTGGVAMSNAGGFKKGGAAKKHFAAGGKVDSGHPVAMPEGNKAPSKPAVQTTLSGVFAKGGSAKKKVTEPSGRGAPKRYAAGGMADGGMPDQILAEMESMPNLNAQPPMYAQQSGFQNPVDQQKAISMNMPQAAVFYPEMQARYAGYANVADMMAAKGLPAADYYAQRAGYANAPDMAAKPQGNTPPMPKPVVLPPVVPPKPVAPPKPVVTPKPVVKPPVVSPKPKVVTVPPPKPAPAPKVDRPGPMPMQKVTSFDIKGSFPAKPSVTAPKPAPKAVRIP